MAVLTDPQNLSKQDLVALVYDLQRQNSVLKQEVQRLIERLNPPKKKFFRLSLLTRRSKRPGQKPGHPGLTRATPKKIDRVVEQTLTHCQGCHTRLGPSVEVTKHPQEDLIPARVGRRDLLEAASVLLFRLPKDARRLARTRRRLPAITALHRHGDLTPVVVSQR